MRHLLSKAIVATALLSGTLFGADLFPLFPGNTWTYREFTTGNEFTVRVSTPVVINEIVYHSLLGYAGNTLLVRPNNQQQMVYLDEETGQELLLIDFEPSGTRWWPAPLRTCQQEGQTQRDGAVYEGAPGPFFDVLEIHYRSMNCGDTGTQLEQFTENIGMLRRVVSSIAGPREYNLVYAKVGAILIEASQHSRFTLTVVPGTTPHTLAAVLRLQTNSQFGVTLPYTTAQEYEVELLNEQGTVVWRWSDGQFFIETPHTKNVIEDWTVRAEFPKPNLSTGEPRIDHYTVRAWLTTEGAPAFSAKLPIIITSQPEELSTRRAANPEARRSLPRVR
jgi:hypothetical protein